MSQFDYDLFVIGAGSGGVRAARLAAEFGARVAIAEDYRVGGTCVIRGCVPKKLFVYASRFREAFEDAPGYGWTVGQPSFDWPTLMANKDREIARLSALYEAMLARSGVALFRGRASLTGPNSLRISDGKEITAGTILIATGGTPIKPRVPGADVMVTSNEIFELDRLPKSIAIVGAGYIGMEFGAIFEGLGAEVTIIQRGPRILREFDHDLGEGLTDILRQRGVRVETGAQIERVEKAGDRLRAVCANGLVVEADMVMAATGRAPNVAGLGLVEAGVECGWNGHVVVDEFSRSSVPSVYAIGDVTDRVALTPVAIHEGDAFARTVFNDQPTPVDHAFIPTAVFSSPEIASVGLSEENARERCPSLDIYKSMFRPMRNVLAGREERTTMKLLVDPESDRVLGVHVLGPDAAEIVQMAAIALRLNATKADFDRTRALHPSAAEELVTMRTRWEPAAKLAAE